MLRVIFLVSDTLPLSIEFFEDENWNFQEFSTSSFSDENWGCYNESEASVGSLISATQEYCEMIDLPETGSVLVGIAHSGSGPATVKMKLYTEFGTGELGSCDLNLELQEGCSIAAPEMDKVFSEGSYQVCVTSDDPVGYRIYEDITGDSCGFIQSTDFTNNSKDFAIFAKHAKYDTAATLNTVSFNDEKFIESANQFIQNRYGGDCRDDCILPIKLSGIYQTLMVSDFSFNYTKNLDVRNITNSVYDLFR